MNDANNTLDPGLDFSDYWAIAMRRRREFLTPLIAVLLIGAALALLLPSTYRSEATFLIQRQSIPQSVVPTTVNAYVQEQIQQIRERLVARENVLELADKFNLAEALGESNPGALVAKVREAIEVRMVDITASDPDRVGQRRATIAFTVAFSAPDPKLARDVTRDLTSRYQAYHREQRAGTASDVTQFLTEQANQLAAEIEALEVQLADFKQEERTQLPEMMTMNLSLFEKAEQQMESTRERIRTLEDRINISAAELALTEPYEAIKDEDGRTILSAAERLGVLTTEYLRATSRYAASHPRVQRLSREIRTLASQAGTGARADELMAELIRLQESLRTAQRSYEPDHPTVVGLEKSIAALQSGFRNSVIGSSSNGSAPSPTSPRYVALRAQLEAHRSNLRAERQRLEDLTAKHAEYEERLFQTPVVERDYKSLARDYQNATQKYQDLRKKQMEADIAQQLESGGSAEQFNLASPAFLPSAPESPNRLGIMLIAGLLGLLAGLAVVIYFEYLDDTIRSAKALERLLGTPPLATIPNINAAA